MRSEFRQFRYGINTALLSFIQISLFAAIIAAQAQSDPILDKIKFAEQPDGPAKLSIPQLPAGQRFIGYQFKNVSAKSIQGFVVTGFPLHSFDVQLLGPALPPSVTRGFMINPELFKEGTPESLLKVDYVLFNDGSSWGPNAAGESEVILGLIEGKKTVAADARRFVEQNDEVGLNEFITKSPFLNSLSAVENKTKRQLAVARGYASGIYDFKESIKSRGDLKGIPARISDIERNLGIESAVADTRKKISFDQGLYSTPPPIKFVDLTIGKTAVNIDQSFVAGLDWLKGLTFKIKNTSGKTIKFLNINLDFPETAASGNMMSHSLAYGWPAGLPTASKDRELQTGIEPNETFELALNEIEYGRLQKFLASRQNLDTLTRLNIGNISMHFDDGTGWSVGSFTKQDPDNPRRWIPVQRN